MSGIKIQHRPRRQQLEQLGVFDRGVWSKEISVFPWTYEYDETCYFLTGEVLVTPGGGEPVTMGERDVVTLAAGLSCTWDIRRDVRKHYRFE